MSGIPQISNFEKTILKGGQPMDYQNKLFYQNPGIPNPANLAVPGQYNQNYGNINTAFNPSPLAPFRFNGNEPKVMFSNHNFKNRNDLIHNNLRPVVLDEDIIEYDLFIDSKDRNYQVYPNPFSYKVTFAPLGRSSVTDKRTGEKSFLETPEPTIPNSFKNVRYIKLEEAILPIYYHLTPQKSLSNKRSLLSSIYNLLNIKEYDENNENSTNDIMGRSFGVLYYDSLVNDTHYFAVPANEVKLFPRDDLGNINTFTISISDPYGNVYNPKHINKNIQSAMVCTCDEEEETRRLKREKKLEKFRKDQAQDTTGLLSLLNPEEEIPEEPIPSNNCFIHNLNHPLNPIYQNHFHFKIGVVEAHLEKANFT